MTTFQLTDAWTSTTLIMRKILLVNLRPSAVSVIEALANGPLTMDELRAKLGVADNSDIDRLAAFVIDLALLRVRGVVGQVVLDSPATGAPS